MSVYTSLSLSQLKQFLNQYELGEIIHYEGISDGIENTNYRIRTTNGQYVLTIFEQYKAGELSYFLQLMAFLRSHGMIVPEPVADSRQQLLTTWQAKPAALFNKLPGRSILHPDISHCQQIGSSLALLHKTGQQFPLHRDNEWGHLQTKITAAKLLDGSTTVRLDKDDAQLLSDELLFQQQFQQKSIHQTLPHGVIHADLFCDNVLFENDRISGIVDFYTACNTRLLYDLAITVNAWCLDEHQYLDFNKARAMIAAYEQIRPLNKHEQQNWSAMLRAAALRFWLSRLLFRQSLKEAELALDKDPDVLKCLLLKHRENISFCQSIVMDQEHGHEPDSHETI